MLVSVDYSFQWCFVLRCWAVLGLSDVLWNWLFLGNRRNGWLVLFRTKFLWFRAEWKRRVCGHQEFGSMGNEFGYEGERISWSSRHIFHINILWVTKFITSKLWSYCKKNFTGSERREIWSGVCRTSLHISWAEPQRMCDGAKTLHPRNTGWSIKTGPRTNFNKSKFYERILENEVVL